MRTSIFYAIIWLFVFPVIFPKGAKDNSKYPVCSSSTECKPGRPCRCYCAADGSLRNWQEGDTGFLPENDEHGFGCYCTEWDYNYAPGPVSKKAAKRHKQSKFKPY